MEGAAIPVVLKSLLDIAATGDVMGGSGKFDAHRTGHGAGV
jgi:hypothetical protein